MSLNESKPPKFGSIKNQVGYGYVSRWNDGKLGWFLPDHLSEQRMYPSAPKRHDCQKGSWAYLCKITVSPITGKRGTYIRRKVK